MTRRGEEAGREAGAADFRRRSLDAVNFLLADDGSDGA
jgi:hypothetical protein